MSEGVREMLNRPSVAELRAGLLALAQQVSSGDATLDPKLRDTIRVAVDDLRLQGWPPERVIIAVKQVAEDAGLRASRHVLMITSEPTPNDDAVQQVVRCCIEHYFGSQLAS